MPQQVSVGDVLGGWDEKLLPAESRRQWRQMRGRQMRKTCLFIAYRYVAWADVEDVWQETQVAIWKTLLKGPVKKLGGYVRETAKNTAIAYLKKTKKRAEEFIGDSIEQVETPVFDERTAERIRELVANFRPELTQHEARVFVLRVGLKWSIKAVAEALEISEDAVKSAHRAAKRKLIHPEAQDVVFRRLSPE
ncbi:RNA polymerase sigma factor [Streptomyces sp. NPDC007920]|uniref:RNA polymerase sigma factor n=1 Tax=Streptomyces sp. NPDC007920 TaxID=3364794 RepID=UPI0036E3EEB4